MAAATGYALARLLGANVIRIAINWASVIHGPRAGEQDWSHYDTAVAQATGEGFSVQIELTGPAPAFATADHRRGVYRPSADWFARFAATAAERYRGEVNTYSIWNEPNWFDQLLPTREAPRIYRRLYQTAYAAIKHTDHGARVLIGELAPMGRPEAGTPPLRFLRALTCRTRRMTPVHHCRPLLADGFALHPYTLRWLPTFPGESTDDVTTGSLGRLVRMLNKLARVHALSTPTGRPLDIYLTEYGWHSNYAPISPAARAVYAREGFTLALDQPRVKEIVWYQLAPPPPSRRPIWNSALLGAHDRITPTFTSLQEWIARMHGAQAST